MMGAVHPHPSSAPWAETLGLAQELEAACEQQEKRGNFAPVGCFVRRHCRDVTFRSLRRKDVAVDVPRWMLLLVSQRLRV